MSVILSDWGCEVYCALSSDEAIGLIETLDLKPDIVVADLRLRDNETGLGAVENIRLQLNADVPAVVMTGNVDRLGENTLPTNSILLAKPVEAATLYREIRNLHSGAASVCGALPVGEQRRKALS